VAPTDPSPLPGEPLALDLLDTQFMVEGAAVDLLASPSTAAAWFRHAVDPAVDPAVADSASPAAVRHLVAARAAIRAVATTVAEGAVPTDGDREGLDAVLAHGRARRMLGDDGRPAAVVEADDPAWHPAVLAAYDLLDLLDDRADRIRQCEHGRCVLWFLDTSRNGTRRWCSMARCGNRAKAERHYRRTRANAAP
jgi:predicted RNA-binding Zn ribbon-like protein